MYKAIIIRQGGRKFYFKSFKALNRAFTIRLLDNSRSFECIVQCYTGPEYGYVEKEIYRTRLFDWEELASFQRGLSV